VCGAQAGLAVSALFVILVILVILFHLLVSVLRIGLVHFFAILDADVLRAGPDRGGVIRKLVSQSSDMSAAKNLKEDVLRIRIDQMSPLPAMTWRKRQ
jgi:hypothetical protein